MSFGRTKKQSLGHAWAVAVWTQRDIAQLGGGVVGAVAKLGLDGTAELVWRNGLVVRVGAAVLNIWV